MRDPNKNYILDRGGYWIDMYHSRGVERHFSNMHDLREDNPKGFNVLIIRWAGDPNTLTLTGYKTREDLDEEYKLLRALKDGIPNEDQGRVDKDPEDTTDQEEHQPEENQ